MKGLGCLIICLAGIGFLVSLSLGSYGAAIVLILLIGVGFYLLLSYKNNDNAVTHSTTQDKTAPSQPSQTSNLATKNSEIPKNNKPDWVQELDSPKWQKTSETKSDSDLTVASYTRSYYETKVMYQKTPGMLQMADIGDYVSPSGGYINYCCYRVTGIRRDTGRKGSRYCVEAFDEEDAKEKAASYGLIEPLTVELIPAKEPTEGQIEYANALEAKYPSDVSFYDITCIISRITDDDEEAPNPGVSRYAHKCRLYFSRFIGRRALMGRMVNELKGFDLALLYTYAVYAKKTGNELGNPYESSVYPALKITADEVFKDISLMESLYKRKSDDYFSPHPRTKVFLAVAESLSRQGVIS